MSGREPAVLVSGVQAGEYPPEESAGEALVPIDLALVPLNTPLPFPLLLREGDDIHGRCVLIKNPGSTLSESARVQLFRETGEICTKAKYLPAYHQSVEAHSEAILTDESIPLEKRAGLLYKRGEAVMKGFFARPHDAENYEKTKDLVSQIVRLSLSSDQGAQAMIRMARTDFETYTHCLQVCILGIGFSQSVLSNGKILQQFPIDDDLEKLGQGFLYHDVGKAQMNSNILKKDGPPTPSEWAAIKRHPLDGVQLLREMGVRDRDIIHITLYHHERMNGNGYPYGLAGAEIPTVARIAAISDAFDALTSDRPYKKAVGAFEALRVMRDENAGFYDLALFRHFVRLFG